MAPDVVTKAPSRGHWSGDCAVLLSYIGYTVGLGNVWRFPYLCYRNGGGAFLIPYMIFLVLAGIPMYYLEVNLGQYSSSGVSTVWRFCPLFKGIGYCLVVMCTTSAIYFNMLVAYILRYLVASLTSQLPWATCDNEWNTEACFVPGLKPEHTGLNVTSTMASYASNATTVPAVVPAYTALNVTNTTSILRSSPAAEFWERYLLELSSGIEDIGGIKWDLALTLLGSWVLVFCCVCKGIKSSGKVVYVTATFPYVVLVIMLVRGLTLPGAMDGIMYYMVPDFNKLLTGKVWGDAASQIFFSLGPAWGILITYGSYNKFDHNSSRDTFIVSFMCAFTSLLSGFVVFSVIGFLAHEFEAPIDDVMTSGPGLAFVAYPEALSRMPIAPLWAVLFFLMLLMVAIDSMFACFETVLSAFVDEFPEYLLPRKSLFAALVAFTLYLIGLPLSTRGGIYILTLVDWYSTTFPPITVAFLEVFLVSYIYGWRRFSHDIETMIGIRPNYFWVATWTVVTPLVLLVIVIFNVVVHKPVHYGSAPYPRWAEGLGWVTCAVPISCIPIFMIIQIHQAAGGFKDFYSSPMKVVRSLLKPEPSWVPEHLQDVAEELKYIKKPIHIPDQDSSSAEVLDHKQDQLINEQLMPV